MRKFSLGRKYFAFVDTDEYLADQLFINHKVRVDFREEYAMPGSTYRVIMCSVAKKDVDGTVKVFHKLVNKMILLGHTDYKEFCRKLKKQIAEMRGIPK